MQIVFFIHVFLRYIHQFLISFLGQMPSELEPANAVITFGLMLREYIHKRTINIKLAFQSIVLRSEWHRQNLSLHCVLTVLLLTPKLSAPSLSRFNSGFQYAPLETY